MSPRKTNKRSSRKTRRQAKRSRREQPRQAPPKRLEIGADELQAIVENARTRVLSEEEHATLAAAVDTLTVLTQKLEEADVTVGRLRKLLFGSSSEKTRDVVGDRSDDSADADVQGDSNDGGDQTGGEERE